MEKTWKSFRIWAIVLSCCVMALGLVMIIWPEISALAVCYIMGILCVAVGIGLLIRYFSIGLAGIFFRFDLILGICSILLGILLFVQPAGALVFLPVALGVYIITSSIFCIQLSTEFRRIGGSWALSLVYGIAGIILGVLLILDPFAGATALMIYAGISLVVISIQSIYLIVCISRAIKAGKNGDVIDVRWRPVD